MENITAHLMTLSEPPYRDFTAKLLPTVQKETILGVRTPLLRAYAKTLKGTPEAAAFLQALPHAYYEENTLHAALLPFLSPDVDATLAALTAFLPYVDNWATCDSIKLPLIKKQPAVFYPHILDFLRSGRTFTVRFALDTLLFSYLKEAFDPSILDTLTALPSGDYYIDMALSWYVAEAVVKQPQAAFDWLERGVFSDFVHNKAIQKACESYRVTPEQKLRLKALKRR